MKLAAELKSLGLMMLFFAAWFIPLLAIKNLLLESYEVPMTHLSAAIIGALVLIPRKVFTQRRRLRHVESNDRRACRMTLPSPTMGYGVEKKSNVTHGPCRQ